MKTINKFFAVAGALSLLAIPSITFAQASDGHTDHTDAEEAIAQPASKNQKIAVMSVLGILVVGTGFAFFRKKD